MSERELAVSVSAFETSGFTGSIDWYRNLDRNWHLLADVDPIVHAPALMIRSQRDAIPNFERLPEFVPNVEEITLDCGHWIQQELPDETTHAILNWLEQRGNAEVRSSRTVSTGSDRAGLLMEASALAARRLQPGRVAPPPEGPRSAVTGIGVES